MDKQVTKIAYIIQARMKSERLPGKVLMPIPLVKGRSILERIVDNLKNIDGDIIVATSVNPENDQIESFCKEKKILCFRGDEKNVLSRFLAIQKNSSYDVIVRLTADNPFLDLNYIEKAISYLVSNQLDYVYTKGLPLGMNVEVIKGDTLVESEKYIQSESDKEHVTLPLKRENCFKTGSYNTDVDYERYRLTVDTAQDFLLASALLQIGDDENISGMELVKYIEANFPWLLKANTNIFQKNAQIDIYSETQEAIKVLQKLEYNQTANYLIKNIISRST
ncbi:cytidylyltransferase domain-containing protein [Mesonia aquimarina]|uniref:cytidylyltransferase domain-containing protein n=1 Tax=Mesonia aquimarina TaxID=1504967 RepID=UPI000EF58686|nr:hypothetical protein [Mesonia aquimarina]